MPTAAATVIAAEPTLGKQIDRLYKVKELIKERTQKHITPLKEEQGELELEIIARLDEADTDMGRGHTATASISEADVFSVADPAVLEKWIYKNKLLGVLQMRLSNPNLRDLVASRPRMKLESAGIRKFTKRTVGTNKRTPKRVK